jgi:2-phosphoglycolate phosphatase
MSKALLLDLDGTLIDTAIDLIESLQILLQRHGRERIDYALARPAVPNGSAAIVNVGFSDITNADRLESLRLELLDIYRQQLTQNPNLFAGLDEVLQAWEATGKPWGIVTNKPRFLTEPLLRHIRIDRRIAVLVCGDDLEQRKPHPLPLIYAAEQLGLAPQDCVYLGDDQRDVVACRAANMPVLVAAYDYIPAGENPTDWHADGLLEHPSQLLETIAALPAETI